MDKEQGRDYPAQTLITHLFIPLRRRLQCQQTTLQALLSMLDGVLINYIAVCLASAKNKHGKDSAGGRLERARYYSSVAGGLDCHPEWLAR